jgi:hypothetical protein
MRRHWFLRGASGAKPKWAGKARGYYREVVATKDEEGEHDKTPTDKDAPPVKPLESLSDEELAADPRVKKLMDAEGSRQVERARETIAERVKREMEAEAQQREEQARLDAAREAGKTKEEAEILRKRNAELEKAQKERERIDKCQSICDDKKCPELMELVRVDRDDVGAFERFADRYLEIRGEGVKRNVAQQMETTPPGDTVPKGNQKEKAVSEMTPDEYDAWRQDNLDTEEDHF